MENDIVSLKVDKELVSKVLNKQIQAAIVAQLGNESELISKAVHVALSEKVGYDGKKSTYSSDNTHDFLEVLAAQSIREAAKLALKEWLDANMEIVKKAVLSELKKPNRQRSIANSYADAIETALKCNWNMTCNIEFKEKKY